MRVGSRTTKEGVRVPTDEIVSAGQEYVPEEEVQRLEREAEEERQRRATEDDVERMEKEADARKQSDD